MVPDEVTITPGRETSEHKLTAAGVIVSVIVALVGLIHPGFKLTPEVQATATGQVALVLPVLIGLYNASRARVKSAQVIAQGSLIAARSLPSVE